jgi:hypothetical protein
MTAAARNRSDVSAACRVRRGLASRAQLGGGQLALTVKVPVMPFWACRETGHR